MTSNEVQKNMEKCTPRAELAENGENGFQRLIHNINTFLGPAAGINTEDVNPQILIKFMNEYTSRYEDWRKFAWSDSSRAYTRNLVDRGNKNSNLLLLVWSPGRESPVHDHTGAHCIMKVLKGRLQETRYAWPEKDPNNEDRPLIETASFEYSTNQVTYMSDKLGLHSIANTDFDEYAYSLHLYTPPYAAEMGCNIFDRKTGKASHVSMSNWYSEMGNRI